MKKINIRRMKLEDFEGVHKLVEQVHLLHLNKRKDIYINSNPLKYEDFIKIKDNVKSFSFVAELGEEIVGEVIATMKEIKEKNIFRHRVILFIEDICVDKNYKRKGIGRLLFNKIIKIAKENNIDSIELNVWSFNSDAIKFYENMGMTPKNIKYEYKMK